MSDVGTLVRRNVEYANLLSRVLGTRDSETKQRAVSYVGACVQADCVDCDCAACGRIRIYVRPVSSGTTEVAAGSGIEQTWEVTTWAAVEHLDRILFQGVTYEVVTEPAHIHSLNTYQYRTFIMKRLI
jgi:hypothetical protein